MVPSCAEGGVIGALPGIIGSIQASEAIKVITGSGEPLSGRLFILDALTMETRIIKFPVDRNQKNIDTLIDYEEFCGTSPEMMAKVKEITVSELNDLRQNGAEYQLIDVREPFETDIATIGGDLIPQGTVLDNTDKFDTEKKVVVYCRSGKRSANVIRLMEKKHGLENLYNLKGGILAWANEIDPTIQKY
jgi:adenylyltransferase/sulfurtransferase